MKLNNGNLITLDDKKQYIIIENLVYDNEKYLFTNELKQENLTEDYYIFKVFDNGVKLVTDEQILNILLPKFQEKLKKTIEETL